MQCGPNVQCGPAQWQCAPYPCLKKVPTLLCLFHHRGGGAHPWKQDTARRRHKLEKDKDPPKSGPGSSTPPLEPICFGGFSAAMITVCFPPSPALSLHMTHGKAGSPLCSLRGPRVDDAPTSPVLLSATTPTVSFLCILPVSAVCCFPSPTSIESSGSVTALRNDDVWVQPCAVQSQ